MQFLILPSENRKELNALLHKAKAGRHYLDCYLRQYELDAVLRLHSLGLLSLKYLGSRECFGEFMRDKKKGGEGKGGRKGMMGMTRENYAGVFS